MARQSRWLVRGLRPLPGMNSNDLDGDAKTMSSSHRFLENVFGTPQCHGLEFLISGIDVGPEAPEVPNCFNDCIVRWLASFTRADRPQFREFPFNGPRSTNEMCRCDPDHPGVDVLRGSAGIGSGCTTYRASRSLNPRPLPFEELPDSPIGRTVEIRLLVGDDSGLERSR